MPIIHLATSIRAPISLVFDLSHSIDLHLSSMAVTNERAVGGRLHGLIELGEEVTWEAVHFGVRQRLTVRITRFERPLHFRDTMVQGIFRRFEHDHRFAESGDGTTVTDDFDFTSPLGWLGRTADLVFLERYMRRLLIARNEAIKAVAESGAAGQFF
jgi:ligand-binding SRPBCC domain-containing protein